MSPHRRTVMTVLIAAGLLITACSTSSSGGAGTSSSPSATRPTAGSIMSAMKTAMRSATSVHLTGTVPAGSQQVTIDIAFASSTASSGSIDEGSGPITFLVINDNAYFKVDTNLMKLAQVSPPDCGSACGKYVLVPATSTSSQIIGSFSLPRLMNQLASSVPSPPDPGATSLFVPTTFNGQPALRAAFAGAIVEVAASGPTYPLAVFDNQGNHVTFSDWNSVPPISPPPASDIVSVPGL